MANASGAGRSLSKRNWSSGFSKLPIMPSDYSPTSKNWIGRSEGLIFSSPVKDTDIGIETFSAHFEAFTADTFVVIAPDHPLLPKLLEHTPAKDDVLTFCKNVIEKRSEAGF